MRLSGRFKHIFCGLGLSTSALARRMKAGLREEDGQELVEFSMVALMTCVLIFGTMFLCFLLFMHNSVAEAAREASRWASVRGTNSYVTSGTCTNPNMTICPAQASDIESYAQTLTDMAGAHVTVNWCNSDGTGCVATESNATPGNVVEVTVSYNFASVPFVAPGGINLSSTSEMTIW